MKMHVVEMSGRYAGDNNDKRTSTSSLPRKPNTSFSQKYASTPSSQTEEKKTRISLFTPDFQILRKTKMEPLTEARLWKSPSLPCSPSPYRNGASSDSPLPAYLTLRRTVGAAKVRSNECVAAQRSNSESFMDTSEMETIRSILTSLDLAKYKKKKSYPCDGSDFYVSERPMQRYTTTHPKIVTEQSLNKVSFLDNIPPPPSISFENETSLPPQETLSNSDTSNISYIRNFSGVNRSQLKPINTKLKELTERLTSSSAPPSPHRKTKLSTPHTAPPASTVTFWKEPLPKLDQMSFTYDDYEEMRKSQAEMEEFKQDKRLPLDRFQTLPRKRPSGYSTKLRSELLEERNVEFALHLKPTKSENKKNPNLEKSTLMKENASQHLKKSALLSFPFPPKFPIPQHKETFVKSKTRLQDDDDDDDDDVNFATQEQTINETRQERGVSQSGTTETSMLTSTNRSSSALLRTRLSDWNRDKITALYGDSTSESPGRKSSRDSQPSEVAHESLSSDGVCFTRKNDTNENFLTNQNFKTGSEGPPISTIESKVTSIFEKQTVDSALPELVMKSPIEIKSNTEEASLPKSTDVLKQDVDSSTEKINDNRGQKEVTTTRPRAMTVGSVPATSPPEQRRYFKKRLRGPYGEMLEQEMSKSSNKQRPSYIKDLDFLKELDSIKPTQSSVKEFLKCSSLFLEGTSTANQDTCDAPKRKTSANIPLVNSDLRRPVVSGTVSEPSLRVSDGYLTNIGGETKLTSPWNNDKEEKQLLSAVNSQDTRTHIVGELYETEKSYVESLQIVVKKYMRPLKSGEHAGLIDSNQVDEIFYQVPEILSHHEAFLEVLKQRLTIWDTKQKIGDVFTDVFARQSVIDTYTAFINNWKAAKDTIKSASQAKPAFGKFLEHTSREHRGKLTLDALLIMPVQRIPRYELLIKELLKHTPEDHPDHRLLLQAQKEVHDLAVNINRLEREALEQEQMLQKLREIENSVEGLDDLPQSDRIYIRHDFVYIPGGLGIRKDRCLFLLSDILLITSIKKKGVAMRKTSIPSTSTSSLCMPLESNKYKLLMKLPLQSIEITRKVDEESVKKFLREVNHLEGDVATLGKISDMLGTLSCQHQVLDDALKDVLSLVSKQLIEKQTTNSQLMSLELAITMPNEVEKLTIIFPNPEKRMSWEVNFEEAKAKLALFSRKNQPPTFLYCMPVRKIRAGLQITCAVPSENFHDKVPDVWICSSDGYVGQVCVLNIQKEPTVISCTNVCNAKIICITYVPGISSRQSTVISQLTSHKFQSSDAGMKQVTSMQLDSDTSDEEDFFDTTASGVGIISSVLKKDQDCSPPTMWLGAEDGFIYVYDCDDIWLKGTKLEIQHSAAIYDLVYSEEKVFSSLANGDIFVYTRDEASGMWNTCNPQKIQATNEKMPVCKMLLAGGKMWCGSSNSILLLNTNTLDIEHTFQVDTDPHQPILTMVSSTAGVWVAMQNSSVIHLFHLFSFHKILDVNVTPAVTKMLISCDDIITQHKSACLRVSALHVCKNLLWIGTSAGVVLSLPLVPSPSELLPNVSGFPQGHTGHVRLITSVETLTSMVKLPVETTMSVRTKKAVVPDWGPITSLVISAGDGCEDFSHATTNVGRDDSTNHLLIWRV